MADKRNAQSTDSANAKNQQSGPPAGKPDSRGARGIVETATNPRDAET